MKNFPLLHAIAFAFSSLGLTAAIAQQTATDAKVLHDVNAVLENEKAFRGLMIVPKVSHGIVTLTGTVSSEGDKVLAAMEVGQVDGVKTVLNDLEVRSSSTTSANTPQGQMPALANPNGAQTQRLTNEPHTQPSPEIAAKIITIPVNSSIQVRLSDSITTKTAKPDDQFHGTLAAAVYADGVVAIPTGTPVLGRVVSAKPAGHFVSAADSPLSLRPSGYPNRMVKARMSASSPSTFPATAKDAARILRPRPAAVLQPARSSVRLQEEEAARQSEPPAEARSVSAQMQLPLAGRLN